MNLQDKTAVVTGGSRGIGEAIAVKLASMGANIAIVYVGDESEALNAKKNVEAAGARAELYYCDVSDFEKSAQTVAKIVEDFGSIDILVNNAGQANYAASKAGIIGMTKSVARELAGRNVTCNAVAPGYIETDMTNALSDKVKASIEASIPMKKRGKPEDVANAVAFLASSEASYITGEVLRVDGGMAM